MTNSGEQRAQHLDPHELVPDDAIDLRDLIGRLILGIPQIIALALLGLALAGFGFLIYSPFQSVETSTRVVFSFPGFEKGLYPDSSKFQADDLRAPDVIDEALKRCGVENVVELQSKIRSAITIEGIIPPNIVKDRDRLRATGQTPQMYIPDEYTVTLTLPRNSSFTKSQRTQLLQEIISVYREVFRRTFATPPIQFGKAFEVLRNADYPDYEVVFSREMEALTNYLTQKSSEAKLFRSNSTNLTFSELLSQTHLFARIRLNETLGLISQNGLSNDRKIALVKMHDVLRTLNDEEQRALAEESVIKDLLSQVQTRDQNYILGVKTQASQNRGTAPVLDQGVIDSLLANDSYSFMIRRALEASLKVKNIQADKAELLVKIENMKAANKDRLADQPAMLAELQKSIGSLEVNYKELIEKIKGTYSDYTRQTYGDAIRVSAAITNASNIRPILIPAAIGAFLGFAAGAGLSLLDIFIGYKTQRAARQT